jgi:hypothetical protein
MAMEKGQVPVPVSVTGPTFLWGYIYTEKWL